MLLEGGGNCLKYLKRGWNKDFQKEGQVGSRDGCLKQGGELEPISNYCFKKTPLASSQRGIVIKYLKFKYYRRSGNENICQGICKFGIIGK